MTVDQLIDLEITARGLIEQLQREIKDSEADTAAISPDAAIGRISRQDSMLLQETAKEAVRRKHLRLKLLHEALQKMDDGTYGTCHNCGAEIEYERLDAQPDTQLCAKCARGSSHGLRSSSH